MVFLVNYLGLNELWFCMDECAFVSCLSLTAHILSADYDCGGSEAARR